MVINDDDFPVVARNAIILLIALTTDDENEAVDCMLHVWYSALITKKHLDLLTGHIYPPIEDVNEKIKGKASDVFVRKIFLFGTRSLRLELKRAEWKSLATFLVALKELSAEEAQKTRRAVTLAPKRLDFRDRRMLTLSPARRVCDDFFRRDGVLLPMGKSRDNHTLPNPYACRRLTSAM